MTESGNVCAFASSRIGAIEIFRLDGHENTKQDSILIYAHNSPVTKITMNESLELVATASEKGTIIRVFQFNLDSGHSKCLYEFRRGSDWANIHYLVFSADSGYLAASSNTGTVHIFKLEGHSTRSMSLNRRGNFIRQALLKQYIPNYLLSKWSFAQATVPTTGKNIIVFGKSDNIIFVVSIDGFYYKFAINHKKGGECIELERIQYFT